MGIGCSSTYQAGAKGEWWWISLGDQYVLFVNMHEKPRTQSPGNTMVEVDIVENKGGCSLSMSYRVKS